MKASNHFLRIFLYLSLCLQSPWLFSTDNQDPKLDLEKALMQEQHGNVLKVVDGETGVIPDAELITEAGMVERCPKRISAIVSFSLCGAVLLILGFGATVFFPK